MTINNLKLFLIELNIPPKLDENIMLYLKKKFNNLQNIFCISFKC